MKNVKVRILDPDSGAHAQVYGISYIAQAVSDYQVLRLAFAYGTPYVDIEPGVSIEFSAISQSVKERLYINCTKSYQYQYKHSGESHVELPETDARGIIQVIEAFIEDADDV